MGGCPEFLDQLSAMIVYLNSKLGLNVDGGSSDDELVFSDEQMDLCEQLAILRKFLDCCSHLDNSAVNAGLVEDDIATLSASADASVAHFAQEQSDYLCDLVQHDYSKRYEHALLKAMQEVWVEIECLEQDINRDNGL
ncbi:MAG: hypothetical protein KAS93_03150 [Gammaproteobacteria bacterium]|nr:hypothetical protein [Gammaproteobacteria bacterium]